MVESYDLIPGTKPRHFKTPLHRRPRFAPCAGFAAYSPAALCPGSSAGTCIFEVDGFPVSTLPETFFICVARRSLISSHPRNATDSGAMKSGMPSPAPRPTRDSVLLHALVLHDAVLSD